MSSTSLRIAVIGAGMAGVTCARSLAQAGHRITLFEKSRGFGGRMSTRHTDFGTFDHGAQYFTVRDLEFAQVLFTAAEVVHPWSASSVHVLDEAGRVTGSQAPFNDPHFVPVPGMSALAKHWALPLQDATHAHAPVQGAQVHLRSRVLFLQRAAAPQSGWQLVVESADPTPNTAVTEVFDRVVMAMPHAQTRDLLQASALGEPKLDQWIEQIDQVQVLPCWTLMLAYSNPLSTPFDPSFGPHWHAVRSTHHRISWMARENSKPDRTGAERWTVQASPEWSQEHLEDDADRVIAKLSKAFAEVTGIWTHATYASAHRWRYAQTRVPLGQPYLLDADLGLAACGDWCLGHRVEDAFLSGRQLAKAMTGNSLPSYPA